ncbi:hypothetical protein [Photobacterium kasasachensis]|uniref:hypothetical protein n=1 Tax=Photobacterium kasasachensis TaxID=2910240 RepID=UPI003D0B9C1D
MLEKMTHVKNPLTVIAMFAAIAEISGTVVLPFVDKENQELYIWFLMLFPSFLVAVFFLTLNFNHKTLYAPSDYQNEDNFLKLFGKAAAGEQLEKIKADIEDEGIKVTLNQDTERFSQAILAEKLALTSLSKKLKLEFKPDVKLKTSSNREILFDGVAFDNAYVHAIETKLITSQANISNRLKKIFDNALQVQEQWQGFDARKLVFHFYLVLDNDDVSKLEVKKRIELIQMDYPIHFSTEIVTLEDLKNEWQFCP